MIPCQIEVNAVTMPDPLPRSGIISDARQILVVRIVVASPLSGGPVGILLPGEAVPQLIELLQAVVEKSPELTTERLAAEGVAIRGEMNKPLNIVPGPDGEQ